jgi:hypothetical protein
MDTRDSARNANCRGCSANRYIANIGMTRATRERVLRCVVAKMDVPSKSGRFVSDFAASACGVLILLLALWAFNERFREQFSFGAGGADGAGIAVLNQVNEFALLIALVAGQVVREQSVEHAWMMGFAAAALVLVIFLLRV